MFHLPGYNNHPTAKQIKRCITLLAQLTHIDHLALAQFSFTNNGEGQKTIHKAV